MMDSSSGRVPSDTMAMGGHNSINNDNNSSGDHSSNLSSNINSTNGSRRRDGGGDENANDNSGFSLNMGDVTSAMGQTVAKQVLQSGTESATKFVSAYARIDVLRPYFDVEPSDIRQRLIAALWPQFSRSPQEVKVDLYGPVMITLTLSAVLLLSMKHTGYVISREGTLIGTSFAVSFGYWFTLTGILYSFGFIFNTSLSLVEFLCVSGYSLLSYCIVLFLSHHITSTYFGFYVPWLLIGGLGALRLGFLLRSRTPDAKQGFIMLGVCVAVHMLYLLYLQYAYATIYSTLTRH